MRIYLTPLPNTKLATVFVKHYHAQGQHMSILLMKIQIVLMNYYVTSEGQSI